MPHLKSFRYVDGDADGVPKSDDVLSSRQRISRDDKQTNIFLGRNYTRRTGLIDVDHPRMVLYGIGAAHDFLL